MRGIITMAGLTWPCLEFTKTVGWEARDRSDDELDSFAAIVKWGLEHGTLSAAGARRLRALAKRRPRATARVFTAAIELRALVYGIFAAIGHGASPAAGDLRALNRWLSKAMPHLELVASSGGYRLAWRSAESLESVLWPVIGSAAELLVSPALDSVRLCAADDCGWLFIDASRNRSRRWCDMSKCGNRAKAGRYRRRRHAPASRLPDPALGLA